MSAKNDFTDIVFVYDCTVTAETEKAYRLNIWRDKNKAAKEFWVPKSQCNWIEKEKTMAIMEWFALEAGISGEIAKNTQRRF